MTTGRDQDSLKTKGPSEISRTGPKSSVLPRVRYHPSITVPAKTQEGKSNKNCLKSPKSQTINGTKSEDSKAPGSSLLLVKVDCGRTLKGGAKIETQIQSQNSNKKVILPHVRYHPSIRIKEESLSSDNVPGDLQLMTTNTESSDPEVMKKTCKSVPEVWYHPSIRSKNQCEEEKEERVRPAGGTGAQGDAPLTQGLKEKDERRCSERKQTENASLTHPGESEYGTPSTSETTHTKGRRKKNTSGKPGLKTSRERSQNTEEVEQKDEERAVRGSCDAEASADVGLNLLGPGSRLDPKLVEQVEVQTQGQRTNPDWFKFRKNRITASVAHAIANSGFANGKTSIVPKSYLSTILGESRRIQTRAMSWGVKHEAEAVRKYQEQQSAAMGSPLSVRDCGLFIDPERPWLAASPDGIVTDRRSGRWLRCLEVKCPFKHRQRTVEQAAMGDPEFCLEIINQEGAPLLSLKKTHPYFTQVQAQMSMTGLDWADFVVFTLRDLVVIPVQFDPNFWEETVRKLERFYRDAVIPALTEKTGSGPGLNQDQERREASRREI